MGLVCACLPTVGPWVVAKLHNEIGTMRGKTPTDKESGSSLKPYSKTLRTFGGGVARGSGRGGSRVNSAPVASRVKGDNGTGSFERLHDDESLALHDDGQPPGLWPGGYQSERETTISGKRASSEGPEGIPLESIGVRQELSWAESKKGDSADSGI